MDRKTGKRKGETMKQMKLLRTAFLLVLMFLAKTASGATNITVDGSVKYQKIAGFEVQILGALNNPNGFGETLPSIGQQLVNDFGFRIIKVRENLRDFEPANDDSDPFTFNWSAYNTTFGQPGFVEWFQNVKAMYDAGAEIHLSSFEAPDWMKVPSGDPGRYKLDPAYPRPDLYHEIAELWAAPLVHLRDVYGVEVESIVVWNEPTDYPWGSFQFSRTEYVETVKALGSRFQAESLGTAILTGDDGSILDSLTITKDVLNDSAAAPYASGMAYHTYKGSAWLEPDDVVGDLMTMASDATLAASGLELRMTEWAPKGTDQLSGQALVWAKHIYNCHVFGRTSVVDLWYIGPLAWSSDVTNSIEDDGSGGLRWRKKMYAFKQFAKYIDQDSERIDVTPTVASGTSTPAVSAYLHPTAGRLTLVAINRSSSNKTIDVTLQNLTGHTSLDVYRTSAGEDCAFVETVAVAGGSFSYDLTALSVTTFTDTCTASCAGKACGPDGCGGSCGTCSSPRVCDAMSQCACPQGTQDCSGACADLSNDQQNCGSCGKVCGQDEVCNQANCQSQCANGLTQCGRSCVDLATDSQNCGACGKTCAQGESCAGGECSAACPDADGDGHADANCGGDDCDDASADVHPGAAEICSDGLDNDCDGLTDVDDTVDCGAEPDGGDAGGDVQSDAGMDAGADNQADAATDGGADAAADRSGSLNGGCSCRNAGAAGRPWLWLFILAACMLERLQRRRYRA